MAQQSRNTSSLQWMLEQMADEMKSAGVFLSLSQADPEIKAQQFINAVLSLAQTPMTGTVKGTMDFPETLSKFSIELDISADEEVTVSDVKLTHLFYSPVTFSPDLDGKLKRIAGISNDIAAEIDQAIARRLGNLEEEFNRYPSRDAADWNTARVEDIKAHLKDAYVKPRNIMAPLVDGMRFYNEHAKTELSMDDAYLTKTTGESDPNEALLQFAQNLSGLSREELIARFF